jgi:hypothetical protein
MGYNTVMLVVAFLQWWYGPGWRDASNRLTMRMQRTYLSFSVPILLRTLFEPWRRIVTTPNNSLQAKFRALIDNTVSRFIGLSVRLLTLFVACALLVIYAVLGGILLLLWPVLPLAGPVLIVGGLL